MDGQSQANELHQMEERERSEANWAKFLNTTLGLLGFPLGLACLGTKTPSLNALLSVIFVFAMWAMGRHLMPAHFKENAKSGLYELVSDRVALTAWLKFSKRSVPAVMGHLYLCAIVISHFSEWLFRLFGHLNPVVQSIVDGYVGALYN